MSDPECGKTRFELAIEFIRVVAWPTLTICVLLAFWGPLREAAALLPGLVAKSETITVAGVSLKVSGHPRLRASPDIQRVMAQISAEGIKRLLNTHPLGWSYGTGLGADGRAENAELLRLGLYREATAEELREISRSSGDTVYGVRITELGEQTRAFVFLIISDFVQELERVASDKRER